MEFTLEETFATSPETTFAAVANIDAFGEWMPGFVAVERLTDGDIGLGTQFLETRKLFGKEATEHFEITQLDAPKTLELRVDGTKGSSKKGEYLFTYTFSPTEDGGTRMHMTGRVSGMGFAGKVAGKLLVSSFKKAIAKDHEALKAWVEKQESK